MNRVASVSSASIVRVPCASGDEPGDQTNREGDNLCSPHKCKALLE